MSWIFFFRERSQKQTIYDSNRIVLPRVKCLKSILSDKAFPYCSKIWRSEHHGQTFFKANTIKRHWILRVYLNFSTIGMAKVWVITVQKKWLKFIIMYIIQNFIHGLSLVVVYVVSGSCPESDYVYLLILVCFRVFEIKSNNL